MSRAAAPYASAPYCFLLQIVHPRSGGYCGPVSPILMMRKARQMKRLTMKIQGKLPNSRERGASLTLSTNLFGALEGFYAAVACC